ncbi:MAG TPA: protein kinase, partial [Pseudonocardiaceae bacterium]|nr:protein kinase [Pseudonocardiaceae bacterium]
APEFAADPEFRRRFEREALMAGRLDHPHIIPVYDAGEADGVLYLAMRFVDGPDLATVIRTSPGGLDPTRVCVIVSQVASALDAAHARGLVHCDVKPANILIDREPGGPEHAYLSDFGLTRRSEGTQSGAVTGTTSYMAPERFSGAPATPSVDVYALGCVAYACLAGSPPFDGDNEPSVIAGHLYEKPPSISGRRPGLPAGIGEVLDKALAKTPADRYSSCEAFAAALREALGGGAPSGGTASAAPIPDTVPRAAISSPSALPPTRPKRVRILASAPRSRWAAVIGVVALALVATLVALTGWPFGSRDAAVATRLTGQVATLAADPAGGVYFATLVDPRIYKLEPSGTIRVIAGTGVKGDSGDDGPADKAQLTSPEGLAVDRMGDLYVADGGSNRVRKIDSAGTITTIAGNGTHESAVDGGPAARARIWNPRDVAIDRGGNIYVAEAGGRRVRKIDPRGMISTVAGTGVSGFSGDGGLATKAQLGYPVAVTTDEVGNLYIADSINSRIRRVDPAGVITTVVGDGTQGGTDDYEGPATAAHLNLPTDLAIDRAGDLYITDSFNDRILKVTGGQVSTVAGNGVPGFSGDGGSATSAHLAHPLGAVIDQDGSIVIADAGNHRVRRVNPAGTISTISTIAGTGPDYPGDGGPATQADLRLPYLARLDPLGRLVIADTANNRIRRVDPSGVISTIAGTGAPGYSGDKGNAIDAQLNHPRSLVFDPAGNLYIADTGNHRVRKVTPDGKITTIAGTGVSSYSGDNGPAAEA